MRGKHRSVNKQRRSAAKRRNRVRHDSRRRRNEAAKAAEAFRSKIGERFGSIAHGMCLRKVRYNSFHQAWVNSKRLEEKYGVPQHIYKCPLGCGGYHLTTHPMDVGVWRYPFLKPSEIFQRSREAAVRKRQIDAEIEILANRPGPQGHSYERAPKNDVRDPMRHVIEMISDTEELRAERKECQKDVDDAWSLCSGVAEYHEFGREAEQIVAEYYVYGKSVFEVARSASYSVGVVERAIAQIVEWCDEMGTCKLRRAIACE